MTRRATHGSEAARGRRHHGRGRGGAKGSWGAACGSRTARVRGSRGAARGRAHDVQQDDDDERPEEESVDELPHVERVLGLARVHDLADVALAQADRHDVGGALQQVLAVVDRVLAG
eukprot:2384526-Prymnesium_polylepis.1